MFEHLIEDSKQSPQRPKVPQQGMTTRASTSNTPSTMSRMTNDQNSLRVVHRNGHATSHPLGDFSNSTGIEDIDYKPNALTNQAAKLNSDSKAQSQSDFAHHYPPPGSVAGPNLFEGGQIPRGPPKARHHNTAPMNTYEPPQKLHLERPIATQSPSFGPRRLVSPVPRHLLSPGPRRSMPEYIAAPDKSLTKEQQEGFQVSDDFVPEIIPAAEIAASITSDPKLQLELSTLRETVQKVCDQQARLAHEVSEIRHIKSQSQSYRKLEEGQTRITESKHQMQGKIKAAEEKSNAASNSKPDVNTSAGTAEHAASKAPLSPKLEKMLADYFGVSNNEEEHSVPDTSAEAAQKKPTSSTKSAATKPVKAKTIPAHLAGWTRLECFRLGLAIGALGAIGGVVVAHYASPGEKAICCAGFFLVALIIWLSLEEHVESIDRTHQDFAEHPERYHW